MSKEISTATRLDKIPGIGPATAEKLAGLGLETAEDLLYLLPRSWEDLTQLSRLVDLVPNGQRFTVKATLSQIRSFRTSTRRMTLTQAVATDATGQLPVIWFNQPYLAKSLHADTEYFITGQLIQGKRGLTISNPSLEPADHTPIHSGRIVPLYSSVGGLTTKMLRRIFLKLLPSLVPIPDSLPPSLIAERDLLDLDTALRELHNPTLISRLELAKQRLAFDELLSVQLQVQANKQALADHQARPIPTDLPFIKSVIAQLPFTLTAGQKRALWDILQDLSQAVPTNRMLEGDVGSGKTIVAAIAMFQAAQAGFQSALMVPTEVLAEQHFATLSPLAQALGISISLQTQTQTIGDTTAQVVIGTHKLIQKTVDFLNLNLVIVDEQHRFGVKQREALKLAGQESKHLLPHFISLTATPIPRSLALTIFGDLDLSIIPARPVGRLAIQTQVVTTATRKAVYQKIASELAAGHQAFIVTPLIATSPRLTAKSAEQEAETLRHQFPTYSVGILHGKLSAEEKARTMHEFKAGKIHLLVATTVIEVGIDVPNATVMLIEGAERFGLAQLHQLRGRVGRSQYQSYCFVAPTEEDTEIVERLTTFAQTTDGFKLAELDLELRGPGSMRGTMQAGFVKFRLADWNDPLKIEAAQTAARSLLAQSPDLSQFPLLARKLQLASTTSHSE